MTGLVIQALKTLGRVNVTTEIIDVITFKGGTSLSKAFNLISRFSEAYIDEKERQTVRSI